jgi:hypothetical protein
VHTRRPQHSRQSSFGVSAKTKMDDKEDDDADLGEIGDESVGGAEALLAFLLTEERALHMEKKAHHAKRGLGHDAGCRDRKSLRT